MMLSSCLSSFMETEIELPADMEVYAEGGFSTAVLDSLSPVKMIIYYDSADCSSCRISHLIELEPLYWAAEEGHYDVVTIFSPRAEELEEFRLQLSVQDIGFPVYVDTYGSFAGENAGIPEDERFHSFLVGGDGRPVFVGNPLGSEKLQDIFQNVLADTKHN